MLLRTLNSFFQWFCVTGLFYTLAFASTSLSGDPFLNYTIAVFVDLPAIFIGFYTFDRAGRKWSLTICQFVGGVCCLITGFVVGNDDYLGLQIAAVSIGKFCGFVSFSLVWLYSAEMYPTKLRATSLGTCSTIGRVGGIYALSLEGLKQYWGPLPFTLIGAQAVLAGLLAYSFPETTGSKLPETTDEAIHDVGVNYKLKRWCPGPKNVVNPDNGKENIQLEMKK